MESDQILKGNVNLLHLKERKNNCSKDMLHLACANAHQEIQVYSLQKDLLINEKTHAFTLLLFIFNEILEYQILMAH